MALAVAANPDLTQVEREVIDSLAQSRVTASAVTVAADLWKGDGSDAADPTGLVAFVLEGLAERGLVTYRVKDSVKGQYNPWGGLPYQVRLTPDGWAEAGYPTVRGHVGHGSRHSRDNVKHTGDMTNYRNHHDTARGGAIEKEDFATHRAHYPDHIHMYEGDTDMTRDYTPVTPELEATVIAARTALGATDYKTIAETVGVSERTAKYILTDLPRLRRLSAPEEASTGSLKERIVAVLMALPEVENSAELVRILGRGDSDHDVVHVLHSLHTQGKVDFKEGRGADNPTRIHLTARGRGLAEKKANGHAPEPEPEVKVVADQPDTSPAYPLLDALLERERNRHDADTKGMAYVTAAEAIEKVDPDAARDLMAKAEALNVPLPSPIEREYLSYVSAHTREDATDV